MTIRIQKGQSNEFSLSYLDDKSIFTSKTYEFTFTNDTSLNSQTLALVPTINGDRYDFVLIEGTDVTFTLLGFWSYVVKEVDGLNKNTLAEGKMKVVEVQVDPTTPNINTTYKVYEQ